MSTPNPALRLAAVASTWTGSLQAALDSATAVDRYRTDAAALSLADRADTLLAEVQGAEAGSTPTDDHLAEARRLLYAEAMGDGRGRWPPITAPGRGSRLPRPFGAEGGERGRGVDIPAPFFGCR